MEEGDYGELQHAGGPGQHIYIPKSREHELACVIGCYKARQLPSRAHCRLACRCLASAELVLEWGRRKTHAVTRTEMKFWQAQLVRIQEIITLLGDKGAASHHLQLSAAIYRHLLAEESAECEQFASVLSSIPDASALTLMRHEAVMHTSACFFLDGEYARAASTFWENFKSLPSLMVPLEILQEVPLAQDMASNTVLEGLIVILTSNSTRDLTDLQHALLLLDENGSSMSSYPLLVLHDGLTQDQASLVKSWRRKGTIEVEYLQLRDLAYEAVYEARGGVFYKNPDKSHKSGTPGGRGYMHMIRLYAGMLFQHPALHAFSSYARLDTDSFLVGETPNIFLQMHNATSALRIVSGRQDAHVSYGYWWITRDSPAVTQGVWDVTRNFMRAFELQPSSLDHHLLRDDVGRILFQEEGGVWNLDVFYNNLEVVRLAWIRGRLCADYFRYIDWNIKWFEMRWSDAVVRSMQVFFPGLFMYKCKHPKPQIPTPATLTPILSPISGALMPTPSMMDVQVFMSLQYAESLQLRVSYKHQVLRSDLSAWGGGPIPVIGEAVVFYRVALLAIASVCHVEPLGHDAGNDPVPGG